MPPQQGAGVGPVLTQLLVYLKFNELENMLMPLKKSVKVFFPKSLLGC